MTVCQPAIPRLETTELYRLQALFQAKRVPVEGTLELTRRCNLRCAHCYASPTQAGAEGELTAPQWFAILDQIAAAGCLNLLLTGGEPLLRPDFTDIYRRAKELGLLVTVFSNGTLVSPAIVDLFREWPPEEVEVTVLGATPATHDALTGVPGSFQRFNEGMDALQSAGIRVRLKTVLMIPNQSELAGMEQMARRREIPFRLDAAVFPRLDGDPAPLALRLTPADAAAAECSDPDRAAQWQRTIRTGAPAPAVVPEALYRCGAGRTSFRIDPGSRLTPCILMNEPAWDLNRGPFAEGWAALAVLQERKHAPDYPCNRCAHALACGLCPAFFQLENGAPDLPSKFLCDLARQRVIIAERAD